MIPKSVMLSEKRSTKRILVESNVVKDDATHFVPFEEEELDISFFKNKIDAKTYISKYFGVPLAKISSEILSGIEEVFSHTLNKEIVLNEVKRLMSKKEKGQCTEK